MSKIDNEIFEEMFASKFGLTEKKETVCSECDGEGTHLTEGLRGDVTDMINEDPEFAEDYFGGRYDVACSVCGGRGKVLTVIPHYDDMTEEQQKFAQEYWQGVADDEAVRRAESGYQW